ATASSDVYSLGAVIHELCTGQPPARRSALADIEALDPPLARIVARCLQADPVARYLSAEGLAEALDRLDPGMRLQGENPYRGLRPFEEEHRAAFFGRDTEVREITEALRSMRFVLVAGDSGVGKSSLLRAGVIPRLRD